MRHLTLATSLVALLLLPSATAPAVDGVLEINQACAVNTGCFAGDAAGFPVTLASAGSYVLTSVLTLPDENTTGIQIDTDHVTVDLNGFGITGPVTCSGTTGAVSCVDIGSGVGVLAGAVPSVGSVEVRNGFVNGVGGNGVRLNDSSVARNLRIENCGRDGVFAGGSVLVLDSAIRAVGGTGVSVSVSGNRVALRGNSIAIAGTRTIAARVREIGGNDCDDDLCTFPRKRFYLTQDPVQGDATLSHCAEGFHMASVWELFDPSSLVYDGVLGYTSGDSGQGPPTSQSGWIRTGWVTVDTATPGVGNCNAWTTTSGSGSTASLDQQWQDGVADDIPPWATGVNGCASNIRVWCIQD